MTQLERLLFLGRGNEQGGLRYFSDAALALLGAFLITGFIALLHLAFIRNISLLYLFIVWLLAINRGLYAALCASIFAFLAFDFFLVEPLFTFTISDPAEWLALSFFLATAIVTGLIASRLRQSVQEANRREDEARALYQLVSATASEGDIHTQLEIVANTIKEVFAPSGVRNCRILLPNSKGGLTTLECAQRGEDSIVSSSDEEAMRSWVMKNGQSRDLYDVSLVPKASSVYLSKVVVRSTEKAKEVQRYIRLIPLTTGTHIIGIVRLVVEDDPAVSADQKLLITANDTLSQHKNTFTLSVEHVISTVTGAKREHALLQTSFFQSFLNQATTIIEGARLRQESLQMEVLQRTDALRAALLSSVSHDLRTPLSSIKAAAYSLQEKDVTWDDESRHSFAVTIEREADRLNRLVGNILDMSRIEGGALKAEKELYPLDELVYHVINHMQFVLKDRDVRVILPDDLSPVALDFLQMDQVLTNLIENAVRYTPSGSQIEISAIEQNGEILVSVADHGQGIPEEYKERIFDKFYRVSGATQRGTTGTGLGLAVCRGLVEAHGGRIWAKNREGGGAIFQFTLPLAKTRELA
ncbi:MAG: hypothetical protein NVS4B11_00920 [Ktedonobacteraceae bacterium]